jgi:hypothetical protein
VRDRERGDLIAAGRPSTIHVDFNPHIAARSDIAGTSSFRANAGIRIAP